MYLIFDTETTGLPKRWDAPITDSNNWPRIVQIAWQLHKDNGEIISHQNFLIKAQGFTIPFESEQIHGISTELSLEKGVSLNIALNAFLDDLSKARFAVGHNLSFDTKIVSAEFYRLGIDDTLKSLMILDTCTEKTASICKLSGGKGGKYKLPSLIDLYKYLFGTGFKESHNAIADVMATSRCFFELIRTNQGFDEEVFKTPNYFQAFREANPNQIPFLKLNYINYKEASKDIRDRFQKQNLEYSISDKLLENLKNAPFAHLHNHTQYSVLQSTTKIPNLIKSTVKDGMPAVAITDTANMMGVFLFLEEVIMYNNSNSGKKYPIKPIIGCEFYVCENHLDKSRKDNGYQVVFLAKNKLGYHNLAKISSIAYSKGFYYVPRIDREVIKQYKDNLIVLTGDINGEVPSKVLNFGEEQGEEALLWWKKEFKENLYIELTNHGEESENRVNKVLINFSKKHQIKLVATNSTYYIDKHDAEAHDILLCVKGGNKKSTPIGRGRDYRYGMKNQEYYFKSTKEMKQLFKKIPEAIINISDVLNKIEFFNLRRDVLLPKFKIPKAFQLGDENNKDNENKYLKYLTYEGVKTHYPNIRKEIKSRIDFELEIIKKTGYPGYFLIVQDFIAEAKRLGVSVGPGRGSAAGSVVAYCLGITNIDPIKYNLLFERFLNPDRVSMPDIDIDFDDEGRGKVIDYVIQKYGDSQVAQIVTYGMMAARSAVRDTARVLDLPLEQSNRIANLIPTNMTLYDIFEGEKSKLESLRSEDAALVREIKLIAESDTLEAQTIHQARILEGSLRNIGVHACGVIITPKNITDYIPVATNKDSSLYITQFDNSVVEKAGLLKMDFLGLRTLTIIKDTVKLVKSHRDIDIIPDEFPLDDSVTYKLFQSGNTIGLFQYESLGMQKHMRNLKPTVFEDLIAMNALYRPGPMEYIPDFIRRKQGEEPVTYDLEACEEHLKETYGITVYQEQVMLLSQKLANFTKGEADILRKAMGKKIISLLNELKPKFIEGGLSNDHPKEILEKIWKDWESFASYAFNKSHSTCYALIGYQTAYLKANYPEEYMAAVLSNHMNNISKVSFFLKECQRMNISVLSADINESSYKFTVNKNNAIRVGMGSIKGVGKPAVDTIVENKEKEGEYNSIFDLVKRINLRAANKKSLENLIYAGAFDCFKNIHRAQYLNMDDKEISYIEKIIRFGLNYQETQSAFQLSLFEEGSKSYIPEPVIPRCSEWSTMKKLDYEKEVLGIYISGHPLDDFEAVFIHFCTGNASLFREIERHVNRDLSIAGIILDVQHLISRNGKGWGKFTLMDYHDTHEFRIFGEEYLKFKHYLETNALLYIKLKIRDGWVNKSTGKKGDPRIEFYKFDLLQDVLEKKTKKLTLYYDIESINKNLVQNLKEMFEQSKGDTLLDFMIKDNTSDIQVTMSSRSYNIKMSQELMSKLDKLPITYKLT